MVQSIPIPHPPSRANFFQKTLWLAQPGQIGQGKTIRAWVTVIGPGKLKRDQGWKGGSQFDSTSLFHKKQALICQIKLN